MNFSNSYNNDQDKSCPSVCRNGSWTTLALAMGYIFPLRSALSGIFLAFGPALTGANAELGSGAGALVMEDASGTPITLVSGISGVQTGWRLGGAVSLSSDELRLAATIYVAPKLDEAHPTSQAANAWGFADGTPNFRRGSRVAVLRNIQDPNIKPILVSDYDSWSPRWSPNNNYLAYYSNEGNEIGLWIYDVKRNQRYRIGDVRLNAHQLSGGDTIIWDASGKYLFASVATKSILEGASPPSRKGETRDVHSDAAAWANSTSDPNVASSQIARIEIATGLVTLLSGSGAINHLHESSLSPDGRWLATLSDDFHLSIISSDGNKEFKIGPVFSLRYRGDDFAGIYWRPHSTELFFVKEGILFKVNMADHEQTISPVEHNLGLITWRFDSDRAFFDRNLNPPVFTADGQFLLLFELDTDCLNLLLISLSAGDSRRICLASAQNFSSLEWVDKVDKRLAKEIDFFRSKPNVSWEPSDDNVLVKIPNYNSASVQIISINLNNGSVIESYIIHRTIEVIQQFKNGDVLVIGEDFSSPGNLYRMDKRLEFTTRPLVPIKLESTAKNALKNAALLVQHSVVPRTNGTLSVVTTPIILPADKKLGPFPVVVIIYPGMHYQGGLNQFFGNNHPAVLPIIALLKAGYAVMLPHTFGLDTWRSNREPVQTDGVVDSLLPQIYAASNANLVDIQNVCLGGYSQGGHAAVAALTRSKLFRCAIILNGVRYSASVTTSSLPAGIDTLVDNNELLKGLSDYFDNSPYYNAHKIVTPMLFIHAKDDPTIDHSQIFVDRMSESGNLAKFIKINRGGHDPRLWSLSERERANSEIVKFIIKHKNSERSSSQDYRIEQP